MRKFYSLLTGMALTLLCLQTNAQNIPDSCGADFERIQSTTNNPLQAYYRALPRHNHDKRPEQICWNFGDNHDTCINYNPGTSNNYVVSHTYANAGVYTVCVRIQYQGGCVAEKCRPQAIGEQDSCRANFETSLIASTPLARHFTAIPWHNQNKKPIRICWNFGDNHDTCIQYSNTYTGTYGVNHVYEHQGTYNVCVNILYDGGCESHYCRSMVVSSPDSCRADFERIPTTANNPLLAYYRALPWNSNDKRPEQICWNFGDNHDTCINYDPGTTNNYVVSHHYSQPGVYNVCVRIKYQGGCIAYKCKPQVIGEPDSCRADFERIPVSAGTSPLLAYYRALPWHNHQRKPAQICWTFGDGKDTCIQYPENYTGSYVVSHRYEHHGIYEVCVKINYYGGCESRKCRNVNISLYNDLCRVHLFEITPSVTSLTRGFYFVPISTAGRPRRICWKFGDGTDTCLVVDSNGTQVPFFISHTYPGPGVYRACVNVLFSGGCIAEDCKEVIIRSLTGICGGYYTDSLINSHSYSFKGFSIHNPNDAVTGYRWTFGDGTSGLGQQVTHNYNQPGIYRVCLLINTEKGCETRICNDVRIGGTTLSVLQLSPNPVINELHVLFYSTHTETVTIKIINATGVVVRNYTRNAVIGPNNWDFDVAGLLPGVYSLVVQSPNQFASGIFFKQ